MAKKNYTLFLKTTVKLVTFQKKILNTLLMYFTNIIFVPWWIFQFLNQFFYDVFYMIVLTLFIFNFTICNPDDDILSMFRMPPLLFMKEHNLVLRFRQQFTNRSWSPGHLLVVFKLNHFTVICIPTANVRLFYT